MNKFENQALRKLMNKSVDYRFHLLKIHDGEVDYVVKTNKELFELLDNLDECWLYFSKQQYTHCVYIVFDNNDKETVADMFADWSFSENDTDHFNKMMNNLLEELEPKE